MQKFMFHNNFIIFFYMFRALCAHHQEVTIVLYSIWYHHTCRWPSGAPGHRTATYLMHHQVSHSETISSANRMCLCAFSGFQKKTPTSYLPDTIYWYVVITVMECVYCAVRTEFLSTRWAKSRSTVYSI